MTFITSYMQILLQVIFCLFTFNLTFFLYILILLMIFLEFLHFAYNYPGPHYSSHNIIVLFFSILFSFSLGYILVKLSSC